MQENEFRVRAVTRYNLTHYNRRADGIAGSQSFGEFQTIDQAEGAAVALANIVPGASVKTIEGRTAPPAVPKMLVGASDSFGFYGPGALNFRAVAGGREHGLHIGNVVVGSRGPSEAYEDDATVCVLGREDGSVRYVAKFQPRNADSVADVLSNTQSSHIVVILAANGRALRNIWQAIPGDMMSNGASRTICDAIPHTGGGYALVGAGGTYAGNGHEAYSPVGECDIEFSLAEKRLVIRGFCAKYV